MNVVTPPEKLEPKDFATDQEVRWCPGCGDYAILKAMQRTLADIGVKKENTVFVSGIGCAARFPYYMATYGFHTIHGRAPALATGAKSFEKNPLIGSARLNRAGLHIARRNLAQRLGERRRAALEAMRWVGLETLAHRRPDLPREPPQVRSACACAHRPRTQHYRQHTRLLRERLVAHLQSRAAPRLPAPPGPGNSAGRSSLAGATRRKASKT